MDPEFPTKCSYHCAFAVSLEYEIYKKNKQQNILNFLQRTLNVR